MPQAKRARRKGKPLAAGRIERKRRDTGAATGLPADLFHVRGVCGCVLQRPRDVRERTLLGSLCGLDETRSSYGSNGRIAGADAHLETIEPALTRAAQCKTLDCINRAVTPACESLEKMDEMAYDMETRIGQAASLAMADASTSCKMALHYMGERDAANATRPDVNLIRCGRRRFVCRPWVPCSLDPWRVLSPANCRRQLSTVRSS